MRMDWSDPSSRTGQNVAQPTGWEYLVDRSADQGSVEPQETPGLVVDQRDSLLGVEADDTLADAVQHGLAVLQEGADLRRSKAEGRPSQCAGHHQGHQHTDAQGDRRVEHDRHDLGPDRVRHPGFHDADRHLADHVTRGVEDRRLAVGRAAEAAVVDADVIAAVEHGDGLLETPPDEPGVRMREPDPGPVGDHDVGRA